MIPIKDVNPTSRTAWVTLALIALNVAVFLLWEPVGGSEEKQETFFLCQAEIPYEITHQTNLAEGGPGARRALADEFGSTNAPAVQLELQHQCPNKNWFLAIFVAMFLHAGWLHIADNMLFLWIFGNNIEDRLGRVAYLGFYLMGGLAASGLQLVFDPHSAVPSLGASGAIAAILGAYIVMFPRARIRTLVVFFFFAPVELPATVFLGVWFVLQLFSGVAGIGAHVASGTAYWAHVGGFAFGAIGAFLFFRESGSRPHPEARRRPYDLQSSRARRRLPATADISRSQPGHTHTILVLLVPLAVIAASITLRARSCGSLARRNRQRPSRTHAGGVAREPTGATTRGRQASRPNPAPLAAPNPRRTEQWKRIEEWRRLIAPVLAALGRWRPLRRAKEMGSIGVTLQGGRACTERGSQRRRDPSEGAIVDEILDASNELKAGLIVMGSRRLGPVKNLLLGSVSGGVVCHIHCPALEAVMNLRRSCLLMWKTGDQQGIELSE